VIAGYLWIVFAWLLVDPDLDRKPHEALAGALFDLADHVGPIGVAIAASTAAYLVGSVSQVAAPALKAAWIRGARALVKQSFLGVQFARSGALSSLVNAPSNPRVHERIRELRERAENVDPPAGIPSQSTEPGQRFRRILDEMIEGFARETTAESDGELALPATLLVEDQPLLFAEVDRLRAEAELRLAVVVPLSALGILAGLQASAWWFAGLPMLLALLDQGIRRDRDSRKLVADAMARGVLNSSAADRFARWVDLLETDPFAAMLQRAPRKDVVAQIMD
jgi:hypothetical protein